jgi:hypothetical protein
MKPAEAAARRVSALLGQYAQAAAQHGAATEAGDDKAANTAARKIGSLHREIQALGVDAERHLLTLLGDNDCGVRLWAAAHTLGLAPTEAAEVLKGLARLPKSLIAVSAEMTLREWRRGTLPK